ncbi:MAG: hypothetical protein PF961_07740 [Planctomycetota bacterium]|jgi:serine/threonine protein kinase|nr:hypothetical protein [Planctomycetota bacterium]
MTRGWSAPIGGAEAHFGSLLGEGMNATVYDCIVTKRGKRSAFAAKIAHDPADPAFAAEAERMAGHSIRSTVTATGPHASETATGEPISVILVDKVPGRNLAESIKPGTRLPPGEVISLITQGAQTLLDAHAAGIAHRDLKPENLMLVPKRGNPDALVTIDWGEATDVASNEPRGHHDLRPPEWRRPIGRADLHDTYALGKIGVQLAVGSTNPPEVRQFTRRNKRLAAVFNEAAQTDPQRRSTAADLLLNLSSFPEAHPHLTPGDWETIGERAIARSLEPERWSTALTQRGARSAHQALPEDHALSEQLNAIGGPVAIIETAPMQLRRH